MENRADLADSPTIAEFELIRALLHNRRTWILDCIASALEDELVAESYYAFRLSMTEADLEQLEHQARLCGITPQHQEGSGPKPDLLAESGVAQAS